MAKTIKQTLSQLVSLLAFVGLINLPAAQAQPSVTMMNHVKDAQEAMQAKRYAEARDAFRLAIAVKDNVPELYIGLYVAAYQAGDFQTVAAALEKLFELNPEAKNQYAGELGEALYHMGRYDEAIPLLKKGLAYIDSPAANTPPKQLTIKDVAIDVPPPPAPQTHIPTQIASATTAKPVDIIPAAHKKIDKTKLEQTLEGAIRSEGIVIAEYLGYQKSPDITYFHPPVADFKIHKILKGPPLNKDLPVRYEFHDRSEKNMELPAGWHFSDDKMPEKGSQWILFMYFCAPHKGAYDLYQGCYGRLPANEENLNRVYAMLERERNR
ncbi:MAG TPA: hypothetical protein V6D17_02310 [Candidatus Obscuribacterales bacterium]